MVRLARIAAVAVAAVLAGALASAASAHGDPASEYLAGHEVFLPLSTPLPAERRLQLEALVRQANERGFPVRVALIATRSDLGTEGDAWLRPQAYAAAVDDDLSYAFAGRVLVVMPNGFGLAGPRAAGGADLRLLRGISPSSGLARAAARAVERLAAADGIRLSPPGRLATPAERNRRDRLVVALVALAGVALWQLPRLLRRRARPEASPR